MAVFTKEVFVHNVALHPAFNTTHTVVVNKKLAFGWVGLGWILLPTIKVNRNTKGEQAGGLL